MKILKHIVAGLASSIMMIGNITVYAQNDISVLPLIHPDIIEDSVKDVSDVIHTITDEINIQSVETESTYVFAQEPASYSQGYYSEPVFEEQPLTLTYDEFMSLYGNQLISEGTEEPESALVPTDISQEQTAYDQALANYNMALAEYEAASQMIETTKEIEVELTEEVTDEYGNVSEITRTEIQTVTDMVPAGDITVAQANLDAATSALDCARIALDAVNNTAESVIKPIEKENTDSGITEEGSIDDEVTLIEDTTKGSGSSTEVIESFSPYGTCGENLTWTWNDESLTISGTGPMMNFPSDHSLRYYSSFPNISSVIIEEGITSIGDYAFDGFNSLTTVIIPNTVTRIGSYAFYNCKSLTNVTIPGSVVRIEEYAFNQTPFIDNYADDFVILGSVLYKYKGTDTEVIIPNTVKVIEDGAFEECRDIEKVIIPNTVTRIGSAAFFGCNNLIDITIPNSVTSISDNAFQYTSFIDNFKDDFVILGDHVLYKYQGSNTNVVIPEGVRIIADYLFYSNTSLTDVTIPESVISIGDNAFYGCSGLTGITIPDSVINIGEDAFSNCTGLTDITIPNSVTSISNGLFSECTNLTNIVLSENIVEIGSSAFSGCTALTSIVIPEKVKEILSNTFSGCTGLRNIAIPNGVTLIGIQAFSECTNLADIIIPNSVTRIKDFAFEGCSSLTHITIPDTVEYIDNGAFSRCTSLTNINIPTSMSSISVGVFAQCTSLNRIIIPDCIKNIEQYAFMGCTSLTDIIIPDSIIDIVEGVFSGCTGLTHVTISDHVTSIKKHAFEGCTSLTSITIPDSVTDIGDQAFSGCTALTTVNIPDHAINYGKDVFSETPFIKAYEEVFGIDSGYILSSYNGSNPDVKIPNIFNSISGYAFRNCTTIESVVVPPSVRYIGNGAFQKCTNLKNITISDNVEEIGYYAFNQCTSLTSIHIPSSVTVIGEFAFYFCTSLTSVTIPENVKDIGGYTFAYSGLNSAVIEGDFTHFAGYMFSNCTSLKNVVIKEGLSKITAYSFQECTNLSTISIPNSVTAIERNAFEGCSSLPSITLPGNLVEVDEYAFYRCTSLTTVDISDNVSIIGESAFDQCTNLMNIIIPENVTRIERSTFHDCTSLKSITIHENVTTIEMSAFEGCTGLTDLKILKGITSIGEYAFRNCSSLKELKIPKSVTNIGIKAFYGCAGLTSISLPGSLTSIEEYTFSGCTSLKKISFEKGLTTIGEHAFGDCTSLTSVNIPNGVTTIGPGAFYFCTSLSNAAVPYSVKELGMGYISSTDPECFAITNDTGHNYYHQGAFSGCSSLTDIYYFGSRTDWEHVVGHLHPTETLKIHTLCINDLNVDTLFEKESSYDYDHDLAKYASRLSILAYEHSGNIFNTLSVLEYTNISNNFNYTIDNDSYMGEYSPVSFGLRYIKDSNITVVLTLIQGTYNEEWVTDFDIGLGEDHASFKNAATHVYEQLYNYLQENAKNIKGTLKFLVTGHSRGAAAANLVGAYLQNPGLNLDIKNRINVDDAKNIFTYTFATPNVTKNSARSNYCYQNIFNIVNPEDFVTKVVPSAWGFGRYGITYVLPTKQSLNTEDYNLYLETVKKQYAGLKWGSKYEPYPLGMFEISTYIKLLSSCVRNVSEYYNYILGSSGALYTLFKYGLGGLLSSNNNYVENSIAVLLSALNNGFGHIGYETLDYFGFAQVIGMIPIEDLGVNQYFANAHEPESYYSMLSAISGKNGYRNNVMYGIVNCPVNVSVYNSQGVLVGQIINNEVQSENQIWMYVDGDSKIYSLPEGDTYRVELSGNDIGVMDYSLISEDTDTYVQTRTYHEGLELTTEKTYHTDDTSVYKILTVDETQINPTAEFDSETGKQLKVDITVEGRGSASSLANLTPGDYVTLKAITDSNNEFYGWYDPNGQLVSTEADYSFSIHEDMAFTAKFSDVFVPTGSMTFEQSSITIVNKENYYNNLTIGPGNATLQKILWTSSNENIVTVDNGVIRGKHAGEAVITASLEDGTLSASYNVKVLPFSDVPQDAWYFSTAMECYETGLINGTSETTFSPMQTMTRAMVVTILWRMEGQPSVAFNNKFSDVSSKQWYATSISWAEQAGVVHGYGDGTFKPDAAVTREQVAVMLANYAQYKGVYVPGTKKLNEYPDGSQVSTWAQAGMKWAITNGIISGNGAGYLNPKKSATRAEGAAMLLRMKNWL